MLRFLEPAVFGSALLLLVGCVGEPPAPLVEYHDSAGVVIAVSSGPQHTRPDAWRLDSIPVVALSGSDPAFAFSGVVGATRLSDGRLVVLDGASRQVRIFAPDGSFLRAVGQLGEGPGDFQRLTSVSAIRADSLAVFDYWLRRVSIFSPSGDLARITTLGSQLQLRDLLPITDSTFVATTWSLDDFAKIDGPYRARYAILRASVSGLLIDTIASLAAWNGYKANQPDGYTDYPPLFMLDGHVSANRRGIVMGDAERMEFRRYSVDGKLERIVRAPLLDSAFSQNEIAAKRAAMIDPETTAAFRSIVDRLPAPEMRPGYADLLIDSQGFVWASRYSDPRDAWSDARGSWQVFDPTGAWLATVTTPPRFSVLEIGDDYVLGTRADALDVEHVEMLRLTR